MDIVEIFSSIQGEGIMMGRRTIFVRAAKCNHSCPWCDTKYSWKSGQKMNPQQVVEEIFRNDSDPRYIVFTGGEPMLQAGPMSGTMDYLEGLPFSGIRFGMETNGTILPKSVLFRRFSHIAVSPKLEYMGPNFDSSSPHVSNCMLRAWALMAIKEDVSLEFKFVISDVAQLRQVQELLVEVPEVSLHPIILQPNNVVAKQKQEISATDQYVMALGALVDYVQCSALRNVVRVLPQLHVMVWGNKRGK